MSREEKNGSAEKENPEHIVFIPESGSLIFMPNNDRKESVCAKSDKSAYGALKIMG